MRIIMKPNEFHDRCDTLSLFCSDLCVTADTGGALMLALDHSGDAQFRLDIHGFMINEPALLKHHPDLTKENFYMVASSKLHELAIARREGCTPLLTNCRHITGYQGGVRSETPRGTMIVSFSGLPQEHDRLLSLLVHYAIVHSVRLNHFGFRSNGDDKSYENGQAWLKHVSHDQTLYGHRAFKNESYFAPLYRDDELVSLLRVYRASSDRSRLPKDTKITHWDIATQYPLRLYEFLYQWGHQVPIKPCIDLDTDSPYSVWAYSEKHNHFHGIVVRDFDDFDWTPTKLRDLVVQIKKY